MELVNDLYAEEANLSPAAAAEVLEKLALMLAPFAPYVSQEIWEELGREGPVFRQSWPAFDPELAKEDEAEIVVQVNGKLRARVYAPFGAPKEQLEALALADEKVKPILERQAGSQDHHRAGQAGQYRSEIAAGQAICACPPACDLYLVLNRLNYNHIAVGCADNIDFERLLVFHELLPILIALHNLDDPCIARLIETHVLTVGSEKSESSRGRGCRAVHRFRAGSLSSGGVWIGCACGFTLGVSGAAGRIHEGPVPSGFRRGCFSPVGRLLLCKKVTRAERDYSCGCEFFHEFSPFWRDDRRCCTRSSFVGSFTPRRTVTALTAPLSQ